jgi:hypothetical protein
VAVAVVELITGLLALVLLGSLVVTLLMVVLALAAQMPYPTMVAFQYKVALRAEMVSLEVLARVVAAAGLVR